MDRYVVVDMAQAADADNASEYMLDEPWDDWQDDCSNYLIDTQTGKIVFCDRMEPEDASLSRSLAPLVRLLNEQ